MEEMRYDARFLKQMENMMYEKGRVLSFTADEFICIVW